MSYYTYQYPQQGIYNQPMRTTNYPQGYQAITQPKTNVDSVNIDIVNPRANATGTTAQTSTYPATYTYPNSNYYNTANPYLYGKTTQYPNEYIYNNYSPVVQNYYQPPKPIEQPKPLQLHQPPSIPAAPLLPAPQSPLPAPPLPAASNLNNQQPESPAASNLNAQKPPQQNAPAQPIDQAFIKNLENSLSSNDQGTRFGAAETLMRTFKNNPEHKSNPELNKLLNKALNDSHQNVRLMAETALSCGYADGNTNTINIAKSLGKNNGGFGGDKMFADKYLNSISLNNR